MAKKAKKTKPATTTSASDLATAADLAAANAQIPSTRKTAIQDVSPTLVNTYATPALQTGLEALQSSLSAFAGCADVKTTLALATEGQALLGSFQRLQDAANRLGQRVVAINQELKTLDTALSRAQRTAATGSPVQKGLKSLNKLRQGALSRTKAKRTKTKNQKTKAAKASSKA
jgi:hypothetical protein